MKTRRCTKEHATNRLAQAERFLAAAALYDGEDDPSAANVSAANAVMAAIAAADAACCAALGEHAQGESHGPRALGKATPPCPIGRREFDPR